MADTRISAEDLHAAHRWIGLDEIEQLPGNPNLGDAESLDASVDEFGWFDGLVVHQGKVVAGNSRLRRAIADGESGLPGYDLTELLPDLSDARRMAMALAHNHTSRQGRNDPILLADAIVAVAEVDHHLADVAGIQALDPATLQLVDVDAYQRRPSSDTSDDVDDVPTPPQSPVTKPGDVWDIGDHRIVCGSCHDPDVWAKALERRSAQLAFTSPPYADRRTYDETSGFEPIHPDAYVDWFAPVAENVRHWLAGDGSWFINIKPSCQGVDGDLYVFDLVLAHARLWQWRWVTEFCWERNGIPKQVSMRFKNQFEPIYQFVLGDQFKFRPDNVRHYSDNVPTAGGPGVGATTWDGDQGQGGSVLFDRRMRKRKGGTSQAMHDVQGTNAAPAAFITAGLAYPGNRLPTFSGSHEATGHEAAYPVGLPRWFVKAYTDQGDVVVDPFVGSGSTILGAHLENRVGVGIELSPRYVDVAVRRLQRHLEVKPLRNGRGRNMVR